MSNINWQFQANIAGGPVLILNQPAIPLDAYDVATLTIKKGASKVAVPIQPSATAGDVVFLIVSSSIYDAGVTYTVDALPEVHALDGPTCCWGVAPLAF